MLSAGYWQVCLDRLDNQVGVDNVWEQEKLEARKMLVNRAESRQSTARFVRRLYECKTR
jgi:hypothetical protein